MDTSALRISTIADIMRASTGLNCGEWLGEYGLGRLEDLSEWGNAMYSRTSAVSISHIVFSMHGGTVC